MEVENLPKTRKEAQETGNKYYFTGEPCSRGHIAPRKTKGVCVECMKEDWAVDNAKRAQRPKSEASKAAGRRYYEKNREVVKARASSRPPEDKQRYKQKYKQANPDRYKALVSVRRRRHRNAMPKWVSKEEKLAIRKLYLKAVELTKLTGVKYVVDHHYPLNGKEVSGLHVLANLKIMTQEDNLKKSNKLLD
jgi:hypothetical protein